MKSKKVVILTVAFILFQFPSFALGRTNLTRRPATQNVRLDVIRKWICSMTEMGLQIKNDVLLDAAYILNWEAAKTKPVGSKDSVLRSEGIKETRPTGSEAFEILAVIQEDAELLGPWKGIFENAPGAKVLHGSTIIRPMIVIVDDPRMTSDGRALNLSRVWAETNEMESPDDPDEGKTPLEKEISRKASAYGFAAELIQSLGEHLAQKNPGKLSYQDLLDQEADRIDNEYAKGKKHSPPQSHTADLDAIFGATFSKFEKKERETLLWVGATIQAIEKRHPLRNGSQGIAKAQKDMEEFFTSAHKMGLLR